MAGRRKQRARATSTKQTIADAAAAEFINHGYAGASLSRIGERLGLTKGALVYHFRAKADFASYFLGIVRAATAQAIEFASAEYPKHGARRLLLYFLIMGTWRATEPQYQAGMTLFADKSSPSFESDEVVHDWLQLSIDAFDSCKTEGILGEEIDTLDAAELFLVINLGATFFGQHVRLSEPGTQSTRFVRLALRAVGISHVDDYAEEVVDEYSDRIPKLKAVSAQELSEHNPQTSASAWTRD